MFRLAILFALGALALAVVAPDLARVFADDDSQPAPVRQMRSPGKMQPPPAPIGKSVASLDGAPADGLSETLTGGVNGQFVATAEINGASLQMLVDTGASYVTLSAAAASHIGLSVNDSDFVIPIQTANGQSRAAPVTLSQVRVGAIELFNVSALVLRPEAGPADLLGMTFLRGLGSFEQRGDTLVLHR